MIKRSTTAIIAFLLIHLSISLQAQIVGDMDDESKLYAETKQVNQFFRRFNGEEDEHGDRYYPKDKQFRNEKLRKNYLDMLFNNSNRSLDRKLKASFIEEVVKDNPAFLDFHGGQWFAEVNASFTLNGVSTPVTLFLKIEKAFKGSQWSIFKVHCEAFDKYFERDTTEVHQFLHPMSHELDFMNLRKAFAHKDSVNQFASRDFRPDELTLFIYELSKGNMKYQTVKNVKFHFFQIDHWYFELSQFNREGYNRGWLISNLTALTTEKDKEALKRYLFYEN